MEGYQKLKDFVESNIEILKSGMSSGSENEFPKYDLFPINYLTFAEEELNMIKDPIQDREKINCILHLKRALDCQLDIFFFTLGFNEFLKRKNLGINNKLQFLQDVGVIKSRTIERFNKMRNKIEHHYHIPDIDDIEVYYDLISSLISNIEMIISSLYSEIIVNDIDEKYRVEIRYQANKVPSICYSINNCGEIFTYEVNIEEKQKEFTNIFKIYILLAKNNTASNHINDLYIKEMLRK